MSISRTEVEPVGTWLIPAFVDVDRQLNVASHRLLEDGTVCVVVAFSVYRQLAVVSTDRNLAAVHPTKHAVQL